MSNLLHQFFVNLRRRFTNEDELRLAERELKEQIQSETDTDTRLQLRRERRELRDLRRAAIRRFYAILFGGLLLIFIFLILLLAKVAGSGSSSGGSADKSAAKAQQETLESQSESETSEADLQKDITISFAGDCILGTDEKFGKSTNFTSVYDANGADFFFANVKDIFSQDDLTVINLENVLTTLNSRADKDYAFKGDPSYTQILTSGSVEAVNLANNHTADYGEQSFTDTHEALVSAGIRPFGYDETQLIETGGVKVGIFGIYELNDHYARAEQVKSCINSLRSQGAQVVVAVFHWGIEKDTVPDQNQKDLGHLAIDEGADIVIGHHPHVIQGIETYKGKTIAYSLANFSFGGNKNPSDYDTFILQATFHVNGDSVTVDEPNIIPCSVSSKKDINNYQPTPLTGDEAARVLAKIEERSQGLTTQPDPDTSQGAAAESSEESSTAN